MGTRRQLTQDVGATGLSLKWGQVRDDYLREWNMSDKAKTVDEMLRNSSVIGALRFAIEMSVKSVDWHFESDEGEDDERLVLANAALENLRHSWSDHISDALMCIFYGWSMFTITYEQVGGQLLWRKFKPLKHSTLMRWLIADDGGLAGIQQWPTDWPEPIDIERMVIYKIRSNYGSPEGESILRPAWPDYYYAKNFKALEGIAYERNGSGYPVITLPENANTTDDDVTSDVGKATAIVRNIRNDEQSGLVLPFGWNFKFESPGNVLDFSEPISRYEKRILTAALAQFLVLGQDKVRALSLSSDLSQFFNMAVDTLADIISDTFTQYPLRRLLRLNGRDDNGIRMSHSPAGDIDLIQVGDFLQKVGGMINFTAQDEVWLRSIGNMPERSIEEIQGDIDGKAQRAAEIAERLRQAQTTQRPLADNRNDDSNQSPDDRMAAELYNAPADQAARQKFEKAWERKWAAFFDDELSRIMEGVNA